MKGEKLIHIRFEHSAGVASKKDILSTEINLLKMNQRLKNYLVYRMEELEVKLAMERKLRSLKLDLGRLQNLMPEVKIPEILEKAHKKIVAEKKAGRPHKAIEKKVKVIEKAPSAEPAPSGIDAELMEIQKRLRSLS
jgi:hypothetical protein